MNDSPCVVIGASAGGLAAMRTLITQLPEDFPAPVLIVWHIPAHRPSLLSSILQWHTALPVAQAFDGEPLRPGHILVAPPDQHLMLGPGHVRVVRGPKENGFRPAVDPLFRSAALVYRAHVIGVVLSGALDDGTSGLAAIKAQGGITIVQDPADAAFPSMPATALRHVAIDYCVAASAIAPLLHTLVQQMPAWKGDQPMDESHPLAIETRIAAGEHPGTVGVKTLGVPSLHTCPDCHGGLIQIMDGSRIRFRCYTGHAYSWDALLDALTAHIDADLDHTQRGLEEAVMLLRAQATHLRAQHAAEQAAGYEATASVMQTRAEQVRALIQSFALTTPERAAEDGHTAAEPEA